MESKNHNNPPGVLPNFCHLGTSLRAILAIEAGALFAALAASPGISAGFALFAERSILVQPALLLTVLVLCLAGPLFRKPAYLYGLAAMFAIGVAIPVATSFMLLRLFQGVQVLTPLQTAAFSAVLAGLLLVYFHLRSKALSPAVS